MGKNKTSINLTEGDAHRLDELKAHFDSTSTTDVIRRSIAQSSALCKLVDRDGFLNLSDEDGKKVKVKT